MKLYYLVWNGGDGTSMVEWFKNHDRAAELMDGGDDYNCNEHVGSITLPDNFDLKTLGVSIDTSEVGDDRDEEDEEE